MCRSYDIIDARMCSLQQYTLADRQFGHSVTPAHRHLPAYFGGSPGPCEDALSEATSRSEHIKAAEEAGLRYTPDSLRGIRSERSGDAIHYIGANGQRVTNPQKLRRIRSLAIPPAWTDVWICPRTNGHLQVTARDIRGRKQYRYHPKYRAIRDETKFDRMLAFSEVLPLARESVEGHLRLVGLPRPKVLATVVWLLERTLIRVGSEEYARENETFGLTTLRDRHAEVRGAHVAFAFRGKSGKEHVVTFSDQRLAKIVQRCQTLPGEQLFQYVDEDGNRQDVGSADVNDYLKGIAGPGVTAKDFRTWAGTMLAAEALREIGPARLVRHKKASIVQAVDRVAERLGNTRAVCRQYYIHPVILDAYGRGKVVAVETKGRVARRRARRRLRDHEIAVLDFIQEHRRK
jgi:DNA topoisomerase-1